MRARSTSARQIPAALLTVWLVWLSAPALLGAESDRPQRAGTTEVRYDLPFLDQFLVLPRLREAVLSPDGKEVAFLLREPHGASVSLLDIGSGKRTHRFDARRVESLYWSTDGTGLFVETTDRVAFLPKESGRARWIVELDSDREQLFLGVDPVLPHHVWVTEKEPVREKGESERFHLLRIDKQARSQVVLSREVPIRRILLDQQGDVRYLKWGRDLELVITRFDGDPATGAEHEVLHCDSLDACTPVAFEALDPAPGSGAGTRRERLWMIGRAGGDLRGLYTRDITLEAGAEPKIGPIRQVHGDPRRLADLQTVALDPSATRPLLAVYDSDERRSYGLDPRAEAVMADLHRKLPGARLKIDARTTGPRWLVEESGPGRQHARFHLYEVATGQLHEILADLRADTYSEIESVEALPPEVPVEPRAITWIASDGLPVHGLVYVPPGIDPAAAPMVARIHGGPWNHVRRQWSSVSQFLVNRGYIVFEPNFRSSTGFGMRHVVSADGDFGDGRVQLDILEGLDHLHARGLGHPDRVAIIGHSFGGFSTLGAMAFTPERFVAGVASAPPIDLVRAFRDMPEDYRMANGLMRRDVVSELLGDLDDPEFVAELRRKSPEARLADTERPLLILAGGADPKVDIVDVEHYATALRNLDVDVSLLVDDEQGHSFEHAVSIGAYLRLLELFLGHHLGGAVGPVVDPRIASYLEDRLVWVGPSLATALDPAPLNRTRPPTASDPPRSRGSR